MMKRKKYTKPCMEIVTASPECLLAGSGSGKYGADVDGENVISGPAREENPEYDIDSKSNSVWDDEW